MNKLAYTYEEAAAATGYSERVIRNAVRNHELIPSFANSKPVLRKQALEDWLENLPTEKPE